MTDEIFCPIDSIVTLDCIEGMKHLRPGSVDLVFADPPFNIDYDYDVYSDKKPYAEYLDWTAKWMAGVYKVLASNGSFWVAIGDEYAAELKLAALKAGFHPRSWVVWYYTFGVNCTSKFTRSHCHLLYFVKDAKNFTFLADEPSNRVPSARQLVYADPRANPRGRLPDDTWVLRPQDVEGGFSSDQDVWHFPRVCGTFKERKGWHGCQMPEALLQRIIGLCSRPGDLCFDPFCGSGTTPAAAKRMCRRFLSFDISEDYVTKALGRVHGIKAEPKYIPETGDVKVTLSLTDWTFITSACQWIAEGPNTRADDKAFAAAVTDFLDAMILEAGKKHDQWPYVAKDRDKLMKVVSLVTHERIGTKFPAAHAAGWRIANQLGLESPQQKAHSAEFAKQHPPEPEVLVTEETAEQVA
jgi:DNA modification methylase